MVWYWKTHSLGSSYILPMYSVCIQKWSDTFCPFFMNNFFSLVYNLAARIADDLPFLSPNVLRIQVLRRISIFSGSSKVRVTFKKKKNVLKVWKGYSRPWLTDWARKVIYCSCQMIFIWFFVEKNIIVLFFFLERTLQFNKSCSHHYRLLPKGKKLLTSHSLNQIGIEVVYGFTNDT